MLFDKPRAFLFLAIIYIGRWLFRACRLRDAACGGNREAIKRFKSKISYGAANKKPSPPEAAARAAHRAANNYLNKEQAENGCFRIYIRLTAMENRMTLRVPTEAPAKAGV